MKMIGDVAAELQRRMGVVLEFLTAHPTLPVPTHINIQPSWGHDDPQELHKPEIMWLNAGDEYQREKMQQIVRELHGKAEKTPTSDTMYVSGETATISWCVSVDREAVCERVVIGTETVQVPDPELLAQVPLVDREREVVEWKCQPILADRT